MHELKTREAREAARLIDRLPLHVRVYLRDMVYRVAGADVTDFIAPTVPRLTVVGAAEPPPPDRE
jgi:hypothetical protein